MASMRKSKKFFLPNALITLFQVWTDVGGLELVTTPVKEGDSGRTTEVDGVDNIGKHLW
jgi:hypothetical protein